MSICRLAFIIGVLLVFLVACTSEESSRVDDDGKAPDTAQTVVISDSLVIEMKGVDSLSVFDILMANHEVDYLSTAAGVFVRAIDSIEGGARLYWVYSVNDSMGETAADRYITNEGDRIKWHFRRIEP